MKTKDDFIKKVITAILIFLVVFTVVCIVLFFVVGSEPSTLIGCVFGAAVGEFGVCSWIKNVNTKNAEPTQIDDSDEQPLDLCDKKEV